MRWTRASVIKGESELAAIMSRCDGTPAELIAARSRAFTRGDFGFVYDSYHSESNFRRQFPSREEYLRYGQRHLAPEYQIVCCEILAEKISDDEAQVIFLIEMQVRGKVRHYAELAWLRSEGGQWRYHRGQKMIEEELPEIRQLVTFSDFAKLEPSSIY
ncbi:MAG: YchJ family metal-binding protein [Desulfuromonadales bacterium]